MSLTNEDRDAATRLAIQQARDDLLAFVMLMNPSFSVGPHHRVLCDQLMRLEQIKRPPEQKNETANQKRLKEKTYGSRTKK